MPRAWRLSSATPAQRSQDVTADEEDGRLLEVLLETFPASDPPAWGHYE